MARLILCNLYSVLFVLLTTSVAVMANSDNNQPSMPQLEFMKNFTGKNQIKLLNNRFRVDYEVDEVMLLFFRQHGSAPVVLVRPDGSKIYPRDADKQVIEWHADVSYDLIRLKSPMAGPWQALGRILPESKILVLSDIELQVEPLPENIFQYEQIKSEARVVNAEEMITDGGFRDVISLRAALYSTNDVDAENFGADLFRLGQFRDDGRDLDERPRDGVFTLAYYIDAASGVWLPKYKVQAELFTRELEQDPIRVLPNPISYEAKLAQPGERYHYVDINIDETYLDKSTIVFQGMIRFPNGETQTFNLSELHKRQLEIFQNDYGVYRVMNEVFGTDNFGREFRLKLPPFEFISQEPDLMSAIPDEMSEEQMQMEAEAAAQQQVIEEPKEEPVPVLLLVVINLAILIFGFLVIWLVVLNKSIPNPLNLIKGKKKATSADEQTPEKEEKVGKKAPEAATSDDILDLSLPED